MKKRVILVLFVLMVVVGVMVGCNSNTSQDNVKKKSIVNIAIQPSSAFIPLYVARANGWIEEALKEYDVEVKWTDFESGPPMNESFAAGQQDIGVIGDVPSVSAIAAGQENTLIAVAADGGPAYALLVAKDSPIKDVSELKGKKIATVVGSTAQNMTEKLLNNAGLDINSDVELVNIGVGDAQVVLVNEEVDAVAIWEPNVTRLESDGVARILADGSDVGFRGVNVIFARSEYVEDNSDVVKVILAQYYRAAKAFDSKPEEYADELTNYYSLDADLIIATSKKYDYVVEFADEDIEALQDTVSFLIGIDAITNEIKVADHVNRKIAAQVVDEAK